MFTGIMMFLLFVPLIADLWLTLGAFTYMLYKELTK